mmetsp:Transcript_29507/g.35842  ORF Transcript_29507/g.35842 Transcript_29507/m.35842 type:complete len:218 (+) Transcript_29507:248-901(+)|eukprot:CAMPEP_0197846018 /NCGR_PEP_ID=MMETSP1438-20131217/2846_1 /TAXON_ID=1461541 /ORGANISM="Pterosperma sp., Strain CCMP1384" /LENGTH=217 /DNA_ID=CAMNT_0043457519 /DNA_START=245 /DNA_END=898 /DNA_ORIENTATION=-
MDERGQSPVTHTEVTAIGQDATVEGEVGEVPKEGQEENSIEEGESPPEPIELSGEMGECRICAMDDNVENLCSPCDCKGEMKYVHHACIQRWILTAKANSSTDSQCEICGCEWRGNFDMPPPRVTRTREQEEERLRTVISCAYTRICFGIPRPQDEMIMNVLAPHIAGPWTEMINKKSTYEKFILKYKKFKKKFNAHFSCKSASTASPDRPGPSSSS